MHFSVCFMTKDGKKALVERLGAPGLDILDAVREDYPELASLDIARISITNGCPINGSNTSVCITEDLARKSGHFGATTMLDVIVEEHALSKYVKPSVSKEYNDEIVKNSIVFCGVVLRKPVIEESLYRVRVESKFDYAALLKDWEDAGFPKVWS